MQIKWKVITWICWRSQRVCCVSDYY